MSVLLSLQQQPLISWKGKTLTQVTSTIRQNTKQGIYQPFRAGPIPLYRRELAPDLVPTAISSPSLRVTYETPGGYSITTVKSPCPNLIEESPVPSTQTQQGVPYVDCATDPISGLPLGISSTVLGQSMSTEYNARRRVRSAGMIRPKSGYCTDTTQYLKSRNRTYQQNQFHYVRGQNAQGQPIYGTNTECLGPASQQTVVAYKPNNPEFSQSGGVSSSAHLQRLKVNTINQAAYSVQGPYGTQTANALAYGATPSGYAYTVKDAVGFPNQLCQVETCQPSKGGVSIAQRFTPG